MTIDIGCLKELHEPAVFSICQHFCPQSRSDLAVRFNVFFSWKFQFIIFVQVIENLYFPWKKSKVSRIFFICKTFEFLYPHSGNKDLLNIKIKYTKILILYLYLGKKKFKIGISYLRVKFYIFGKICFFNSCGLFKNLIATFSLQLYLPKDEFDTFWRYYET